MTEKKPEGNPPQLTPQQRKENYEEARERNAADRRTAWQYKADKLIADINSGRVRCTATYRELRYAFVVEGLSPLEMEGRFKIPKRYIWALSTKYRWHKTKGEIDDALIRAAAKNMQGKLEDVTSLGIDVTRAFLLQLVKSGDAARLSPKDAKMISDVTANFHRVLQLVKGEPTDIIKTVRDMGNEDLLRAALHMFKGLQEDPLLQSAIDVTPVPVAALPAPALAVEAKPKQKQEAGVAPAVQSKNT